ncbi:MAG: RNA 2',3'-cyclic phosphodiesterase [DPANN group archaeon]|nr:RNA 2',3'-cyclic phosphodiesterase [DPANN group archaeon]
MRLFVAVELPKKINENLARLQNKIKSENLVLANFVELKNMHITLKFLGEVAETNLSKIKAALKKIVGIRGFRIALAGLGGFPSKNMPKILFVNVAKGNDGLGRLRLAIDKNLACLGFALEKTYDSHLTIARIKSVIKKDKLSEFFYNTINFGAFNVTEFALIKSTLTQTGPVYKIIERFGLENAG